MKRTILIAVLLMACGGDDEGGSDASMDGVSSQGRLSLSWSVSASEGGMGCGVVGATSVSVVATPVNGGAASIESFDCAAGMGTSLGELRPDRYDLSIELRSPMGQLGEAVTLDDVMVEAGQTRELGNASFTVSKLGGFEFAFDVENTLGMNCSGNGGEIVTLSGQLIASACEPVSFAVDGTTEALSCPGPTDMAGCYEPDKTFTAESIPAGTYRLELFGTRMGSEGEVDCFERDSNFLVYGDGQINDIGTLTMLRDDTISDCL